MGFFYQDGFRFYERERKTIVIDDKKFESYITYINDNQIKSIGLNGLYYHQTDVNFLEKCPHIEEVNINDSLIIDHSKLYSLKNLKVLSFDEPKKELDLSVFSNTLEKLYIEHNKHVKKIETCVNLIRLIIWKYKPESKNLEGLINLKQLQELSIIQGNVTSLKGSRAFIKLVKLEICYLRNFKYIDEVENNSKTLQSITFDHCRKIENHSYVACLKELKTLHLSSCGDIKNLKFVSELPKLKHLTFIDSNVIDGDITPCVGIDWVAFNNKRHYNRTFEEINPDYESGLE